MTGQQKIFELFEANRDVFCEDIALKFSVSRLTVWKITEAVQGCSKYLRPVIQKMEICVLGVVESSHVLVRDQANIGKSDSYIAS